MIEVEGKGPTRTWLLEAEALLRLSVAGPAHSCDALEAMVEVGPYKIAELSGFPVRRVLEILAQPEG
jgi:hypothetical protein